ncbi:predicted protein [Uncinocarpus reesii 1704]|uniref:Uncharacterized protein n=1 Tax=Uncinocarpus reesii (strain UAMH 1704) TaxID=336963 RepID=C4JHT0_UNCRE|nr:uncharacterized protein UREG_02766 [Uncinocarpus reesii 1704]EEP77917.1 predicted protein [Uncinocarpus reesii 1704]
MPYYVRLLKQPQISKQNGKAAVVTALITITTDLGDSFLAEDVQLDATVHFARPATPLTTTVCWKASNREQKIILGPLRQDLIDCPVQVSVRPASLVDADCLEGACIPKIISAWSPWFDSSSGKPVEKLVLRRFKTRRGPELQIWEETGNSIARHIWDAALAAIVEFQDSLTHGSGNLLRHDDSSPFNVVELGSGCGIVGIALAQMMPNCSVLLTDLEEVREIVQRNISTAQPAKNSQIEFHTLDWDEDLPEGIRARRHDLIFLSDCTYNCDALPALVETIRKLLDISPDAQVLVAWKKRCESEMVFFDLMQSAGLAVRGRPSHRLQQSSSPESDDEETPRVQILRFGSLVHTGAPS